jgi:hypothetical protein
MRRLNTDYFVGLDVKVPPGPFISVGLYPAVSTASHAALGESSLPSVARITAVPFSASTLADLTFATLFNFVATFFAQTEQCIPLIEMTVSTVEPAAALMAVQAIIHAKTFATTREFFISNSLRKKVPSQHDFTHPSRRHTLMSPLYLV